MATTPRGPRLLKGAIVTLDLANGSASPQTIPFQYNPEKVTHRLSSQLEGGGQGDRSETVRFKGAPEETFSVKVEIDAADALERGDSNAATEGIYPQLAALEMLTYPHSQQVIDANARLDKGELEIGGASYDVPLVLFVWGPKRVLPVSVVSVSVDETHFDARLNPIVAEVTLELRALNYSSLDPKHKGYSLFMTYQKGKEQMAARAVSKSPNELVGFDVTSKTR